VDHSGGHKDGGDGGFVFGGRAFLKLRPPGSTGDHRLDFKAETSLKLRSSETTAEAKRSEKSGKLQTRNDALNARLTREKGKTPKTRREAIRREGRAQARGAKGKRAGSIESR